MTGFNNFKKGLTMDIFSYNEDLQRENISVLYLDIKSLFIKGLTVPKFREALIVSSLMKDWYEIEEQDTLEIMSTVTVNETVVLNYELDRPLDLTKLSVIQTMSEPLLLDSSYLLFKQQMEIAIEKLIRTSNIPKNYKISITVNIEDYEDESEILWDIKINLMAGR